MDSAKASWRRGRLAASADLRRFKVAVLDLQDLAGVPPARLVLGLRGNERLQFTAEAVGQRDPMAGRACVNQFPLWVLFIAGGVVGCVDFQRRASFRLSGKLQEAVIC